MFSCKLMALSSTTVAEVKSTLFRGKAKFPYKKVVIKRESGEEERELYIYVDGVESRERGPLAVGYIDRVLPLYSKERGSFEVVVSEHMEIQLLERTDPHLLAVYAPKGLAANIIELLRERFSLREVWFELGENFEKIKRSEKFRDVRTLTLTNIQDPFLKSATFSGVTVQRSPIVEEIRLRLSGKPNALAVVYRGVWILIASDARIYTPLSEHRFPGGRDGFVQGLYEELRSLGVVRIQTELI